MKVVFIDEVHPLIKEEFTRLGWKCEDHFHTSRGELMQIIHQFEGIIIRSRFPLDEEFLENARALQFIGRPGAGLENIDLTYCQYRNIEVFRSPEGNRDAVAEHALGMLLMLLNNLKRADNQVREGVWQREANRGYELHGKTVGIIGYGYMGEAFAQRLCGMGCRVLAYDKYKNNFGNDCVEEVSMERLQNEVEIVSLHTPQSEETRHMINTNFIEKCKKAVYIINTARGNAVHTSHLLAAIESGKVLGACLDVLEFESSSFEKLKGENELMKRLLQNEKVILTPHIAGWTHESNYKMAYYLTEKIKMHYKDRWSMS
jgi:D-3-phosphoglycerate dehydrogenase / 2-oxoglutarate reductase